MVVRLSGILQTGFFQALRTQLEQKQGLGNGKGLEVGGAKPDYIQGWLTGSGELASLGFVLTDSRHPTFPKKLELPAFLLSNYQF